MQNAEKRRIGKNEIKMRNKGLIRLILAAMFLALAYLIPFLTGQIPEVGSMLCPMHLPVLLCGFICGPIWGLAVGALAPILRSMTLAAPPIFPQAICMSLELATYGAMTGIMHKILPHKKPYTYCSLLTAMIAGRIAWGGAMFLFLGIVGGGFTLGAFIAGAITNAIPGIIIQIILVPALVMVLDNPKILDLRELNG